MAFADRLKQLRKKKDLSQQELANQVGVHFTQISRYERGDFKPNSDAVTKIAQALNTTVDYLMTGSTSDAANNAGLDKEIISRFKEIQDFKTPEKKTALFLLDALIAKNKLDNIYQH
ncbi:MAG: helix-turn-helix transcriptional regulator [Bacteroidota bacterium]|nr:helix-turn-helix transcriptional regulator [Bacteroidota bacterium]